MPIETHGRRSKLSVEVLIGSMVLGSMSWFVEAATLSDGKTKPNPLPPDGSYLGQPSPVALTWGPLVGYDFKEQKVAGRLFADLTRRNLVPLLDITFEGAVGMTGTSFEGAVGAYAGLPWVAAGVEYGGLDVDFYFGLIVQFPAKRGGVFGREDQLRIRYRPATPQLLLGSSFRDPFHKYRVTRPLERAILLPGGKVGSGVDGVSLRPSTIASLARLEHAVEWMDRLLTPRFESGEDFEKTAAPYRNHIRQRGQC